jgi:Uncharacterized protein conserved in bacteria
MQHPGRESRHRKLGEDVLLRVISRYDKKGGLRLVRLWREWENVVGPEVAELAKPLGHKDGTLLLHAPDPIAAQQLSYYVPELLERVNAFFGELVFDKVRFELLDGKVPLGQQEQAQPPRSTAPQRMPSNLGSLVDKLDPNSAVGRCYMAYVRHFLEQSAANAEQPANTRPAGASRRGT